MKLQIGKKGMTTEFVAQAKKMFETEKMIRISILKAGTRDRVEAKRMGEELCKKLGPNYRCIIVGFVLIVKKARK